ncbi:MAG TPA: hypothetical protein DEB74_03070 [Lachnospiraceae bacterium]|nr:hypothetical protein [Lachnospiraceae bacterium]
MYTKVKMPFTITEDGEKILFDRNTENTHVLNQTAAIIYDLCDKYSIQDIANKLVEGVENPPDLEEVINDIYEIVGMLVREKVILEDKTCGEVNC